MALYPSGFEHLEIQLEEIRTATNNFHESKVIGDGGFGKVYEGELSYPEGKRMVAFKRLDRKHGQGDPEFFKEISMLSSYKHDNLISLLGFCKEGDEMILIYEHASRGSLDRILNDANLTWTHRLKICLDAAKGLAFLHDPNGSQQRVLHRDIKSANILLDENLNAKVSDFGLSRISPANQKCTILFTSPVGTPGYCDPLYMDTYQLTKESDVYSFGVVLFEVLCGRVCYEISDCELKVCVHFWKKCYEQNQLDEIIFPDLKHQVDPSSVETFVGIAYQCLQKAREDRPKMSVIVEKLKAALKSKELHDLKLRRDYEQEEMLKAAEYKREEIRKAFGNECGEIIMAADPPLIYKSVKDLKALLSKGFPVKGGERLVSVNDKGQVCERIYIQACLSRYQYYLSQDHSAFRNSRFPGVRCYRIYRGEFNAGVRAQFLCPLTTYIVNLVFRNAEEMIGKTLCYKLDGETKCCMIYNTYEREDGWLVVPLHQFTSDHKIVYFEINFQGVNRCLFKVGGFEFQPLQEKVDINDQELEEYQEIVKAASQSLLYKSLEELKELISIGFYINNTKTWFSLNENGEHCEMLSIEHCLISREGGYSFRYTDLYSRFPLYYKTNREGFKVHIRTQFLTPSIGYTVNLVIRNDEYYVKQKYVDLRYKLEGETVTSIAYLATTAKDNRSFIAELYQFTSNGRTFETDIVFEDHKDDFEVEGILFQPLEKVEHEQVLEDENLSYNNLQWRNMKEEKKRTDLLKWFRKEHKLLDKGQEAYAVDKDGKKSLMLSARGAIRSAIRDYELSFKSSPESRFGSLDVHPKIRFGEVAVITYYSFYIDKEIKCDVLSPETTYASYLIYKLPQDQSESSGVLRIRDRNGVNPDYPYIYLVSPPETPFIGQKLDQNTHNSLNRPKLNAVPRQRKDGWKEVKVCQFQTPTSTKTVHMHLSLLHPGYRYISGLIIESIELRPLVRHSV